MTGLQKPASLMMVTYNRLDLTKKTLDSIFKNTDYPYELIIIDNNSVDNTKKEIYRICADETVVNNKYLKSTKFIFNDKNLGIAHGRNQGLAASSGDWLVTIDNDVLLPEGWLSECIGILDSNPDYGMIGVNMEGVKYPLVSNNCKEWECKVNGYLGTTCVVFSRNLHSAIGYFNMDYKLFGQEDVDFGIRASVLGLKAGYIKEHGMHLLGEGEDGKYKEFKAESYKNNLSKFDANCMAYLSGKKSLYINFKP